MSRLGLTDRGGFEGTVACGAARGMSLGKTRDLLAHLAIRRVRRTDRDALVPLRRLAHVVLDLRARSSSDMETAAAP